MPVPVSLGDAFRLTRPRSRSTGEVEVWYCPTDGLGQDDVDRCQRLLSSEEVARGSRFVSFRDRRDHATAHALTRWALSHHAETPPASWRFELTGHGKPNIAVGQAGDPPLTFSLTHSHGIVACAIARGGAVGIDVERITLLEDARDVAAHCFSPAEVEHLDACPPDKYAARFTELWTLKEAYIKGTGMGLACSLDSFSFSFPDPYGVTISGSVGGWSFALIEILPDIRMALARLSDGPAASPHVIVNGPGVPCHEAPTLVRSTERLVCRFEAAAFSIASIGATGCSEGGFPDVR